MLNMMNSLQLRSLTCACWLAQSPVRVTRHYAVKEGLAPYDEGIKLLTKVIPICAPPENAIHT